MAGAIDLKATKAFLVAAAVEAHKAFPQYAGHWSGPEWRLVIARRDIKTKMGLAAKQGECVIACVFNKTGLPAGEWSNAITFYSTRNACDTVVRESDFDEVFCAACSGVGGIEDADSDVSGTRCLRCGGTGESAALAFAKGA